jgi:hypothetical protein
VPSLSAVGIAILVGIVLPVGVLAAARALSGITSQGMTVVPDLPRLLLLVLGAVLVLCLVPWMVALGGLPHGDAVAEILLFAVLLGAAALYVARTSAPGWE